MRSDSTTKIREYIVTLIGNIGKNPIPDRFDGKKVSPPQKAKAQDIKNAQGEVLSIVLKYIDTVIHKA